MNLLTNNNPILSEHTNKQTLDFLLPERFADYDLAKPPGFNNRGGGVGTKYARVEEAGGDDYECRRIHDLDQIESDIVFADWLWFCVGEEIQLKEQVKSFAALDKMKVLYGSELSVLRWPRQTLERLLDSVHVVTHNTDYQKSLYRIVGIYNSLFLCDPIPSRFRPDQKARRLVCMGQIEESKRSAAVLDIFQRLSETEIECIYLGGPTLWGSPNYARKANDLASAIEDIADMYILNATEAEVAKVLAVSAFHAHVAYLDVASCSQQENAAAGVVTFSLTHPTMKNRTKYRYNSIDALVDAISSYPDLNTETHETDMREALDLAEMWSYEAWRGQISGITRML